MHVWWNWLSGHRGLVTCVYCGSVLRVDRKNETKECRGKTLITLRGIL